MAAKEGSALPGEGSFRRSTVNAHPQRVVPTRELMSSKSDHVNIRQTYFPSKYPYFYVFNTSFVTDAYLRIHN